MNQSREHFREFGPHSKHKHLILKHYFDAWGHKLGMREGAGNTILYVDACAGRGIDDLGNYGSPLIAAREAAVTQSNVGMRRATPFRIQVIAIEFNRAHHKALTELLAPFGDSVRVLSGTLDDHLAGIEHEFPQTPALYFIDPFGLEPLQAALIQRALAGDRHEVLLLFADQAALRHFGAIAAEETRAERRHREAATAHRDELFLFPDVEEKRLASLAVAADASRKSLDITHENAVRIMNAAFDGEDWLPVIEATAQPERRTAFLRLYSERLSRWGASHVLQIPIVDESGTHAYTLIHASKSPTAHTAMKAAVRYALVNSPLPKYVVEYMKDLARCDLASVEAMVLTHFSSQEVRWTEDRNFKHAPCVKNFALASTPIFQFELDELRMRLERFRKAGRAIIYTFSGAPTDVD